ncbi:S8 family peptidase [Paraburkholderia terrae]
MAEQLLSHLFVTGRVDGLPFKSPQQSPRTVKVKRDIGAHGRMLLGKLDELSDGIAKIEAEREALDLPQKRGMTIAVDFTPRGTFDCSKVEWKRDGIELLTVQVHVNSDIAVLHIPEGKLSAFVDRIRQYVDSEGEKTVRNAALVNAIENIRRAAFEQMWSSPVAPPADDSDEWFQVWLRHTAGKKTEVINAFVEQAAKVGIEVEPGFVTFPGRLVVAARGRKSAFEKAVELLDLIAEIRPIETNAEHYLSDLTPADQADWIKSLLERTEFADTDAPYVCLMDTGVNNGHPLLEPTLDAVDMHTYEPAWEKHDHHGHGSEMAGIAMYGNLVTPLSSTGTVKIPHRLESVKILPPDGETPPKLWGKVTSEAVYRVEVSAAQRPRVFTTMTTSAGHLLGLPSEWSATIDQLAFGRPAVTVGGTSDTEDEPVQVPRLFVMSAGNVPWDKWEEYPDYNHKSPIQNPAQAWNAITVGAATTLTEFNKKKYPDLSVLAKEGDMSPASTTSLLWAKSAWPYKPDVVAEGGNASRDKFSVSVGPESLRVLTTSNMPTKVLLTASGDTSGAAAEVARLCGHLRAEYPHYWPETIRALVIHGANHTAAMRGQFPDALKRDDKERLLRMFGFGLVNHDATQFSTSHRPTLVIQRAFSPYRREAGGDIAFGPMQLHDLPWPADELRRLSEKQVEMHITLSYFVEPNPTSRGWLSKYRYQSFALRFAVKGATEEDDAFLQRVNKLRREAAEDEETSGDYGDPDNANWRFGPQMRTRGSVHSDVWTGTAEQLAAKGQIAVIPVGGWWRYWKEAKQYGMQARYALVVSLRVAEDIAADLYTPIATILDTPVEAVIPVR